MKEQQVRIGSRVRFRMGVSDFEGQVREDRGPLGIKGRHLYLVAFDMGISDDGPAQVELPAVALELVAHGRTGA
jgi:hypothetical protein